jgi:hypothetical protein
VILRFLRAGLRRVFNLSFLAALSLLLGIGLGCWRERAMPGFQWFHYTASSRYNVVLGTTPRQLHCALWIRFGVPTNDPVGWSYVSPQWDTEDQDRYMAKRWNDSWLGFELYRSDFPDKNGGWHVTSVSFPLWFPMVLTLIAPLCWLWRWRRQARRVRLGLCLHCGYDLRATPAPTGPRVARCPECGRVDNAT